MPQSVKRSLSTPNVREDASIQAAGGSYSTDKRRNKLGYHRISVACGHCRRRKIRCIAAKDDPSGRCSNCIRLKKDCNFYPVENTDRRHKSPPKLDTPNNNDGGSAGSSPSPVFGEGQIHQNPNEYPESVPVTPTSDQPMSNFGDNYQPNRDTGLPPRIPISQSASVSRRPSMAQLNSGTEEIFVGVPQWVESFQPDMLGCVDQHSYEDLSGIYYRLNSPPICGAHYPQHPLHNMSSMASLTTPESLDSYDGRIYSQGPSRMGSIDQGMGSVFSYPTTHSPEAAEFGVVLDSRSASAPTPPLTASISEASQFGAPGESGYGQRYNMAQWVDQTSNGIHFDTESVAKEEDGVATDVPYLFPVEDGYSMNGDFHQLAHPGQHAGPIVKPDQELGLDHH
ncbi:unnamed protein product [Tuber melanosporum]|uniref:(Perigord truffle) hypothetical protein n=1 Tax=Tuber melanosporum (strain Mel28) TaxID=656061 RepID=D5G7R6_TUBMM|nr:uncharacterized protein GSTUM_00004693001 [Tuber melanosporum]CAZ80559.1 unnamed protein product [Tuber melanosporum]